jgi:MFS family permease
MYAPIFAIFVTPISNDLGWSRTTISLAYSMGSMSGSILPAATGWYMDRHGTRGITTIAGGVIALVLIGLCVMTEAWQLMVLFAIGRGIAIGIVHAGGSIAVANWFITKRATAASITNVGLRGGQFAVPLMLIPVLANYGWRAGFLVLGIMAFTMVVIPAAIFLRRSPEDHGLHPDGVNLSQDATRSSGNDGISRVIEETPWTLREAMKTRALWLIVASMGITMFTMPAMNLHAVASFQDRGMATTLATSMVSVYAGTAVLTSFGWGMIVDRFHIRYGLVLVFLLYSVAAVLILWADSYPKALLWGLVFGSVVGGIGVTERVVYANYFGRASAGVIRGFSSLVSSPIGPLGALMAGIIKDYTGSYTIAFWILAGISLVGALCMFFAIPPQPNSLDIRNRK